MIRLRDAALRRYAAMRSGAGDAELGTAGDRF